MGGCGVVCVWEDAVGMRCGSGRVEEAGGGGGFWGTRRWGWEGAEEGGKVT